ncbi:MAG TPA: hypothetical protein HA263_07930 [Methanoregulaceae archaeon]|nr:hypothetical protein [Methanoregulaceae archaeon]
MAKLTVVVSDDLLAEIIGAIENDEEETISKFVRVAIRAELARRKAERETS